MSKQQTNMDAEVVRLDPDSLAAFRISQGYRFGDLVITSGQAALDERGELIGVDDFDAQAAQCFANLERVLTAAGSSLAQVIKVTIYLTEMAYFTRVVELRGEYFRAPWPADTIVEVSSLALPELMIEIEAIALVDGARLSGA